MKNIATRSSFRRTQSLRNQWHLVPGASLKTRLNKSEMKNNTANQRESINPDPIMRRSFIKAATLLGLGTIAGSTVKSYANAPNGKPNNKSIGTILNKKRSLGSKK